MTQDTSLLVEWTADSQSAAIEDVGIDHRRLDVFVAEEFLNRPDVVVGLQQVRGKGMAKRMRADRLDDLG